MFASKKRARDDGDDLLELEHESKLQVNTLLSP